MFLVSSTRATHEGDKRRVQTISGEIPVYLIPHIPDCFVMDLKSTDGKGKGKGQAYDCQNIKQIKTKT
jgi:hypothetical protein